MNGTNLSGSDIEGIDDAFEQESDPHGDILNLVYLVVCIVMTVVGTVGNMLVIGAVMVHRKLHVLSNVFIVNLAVTDLIVSAIINTLYIIGIVTDGEWFIHSSLGCKITAALCIITCACSIWTMCAISVNRYICICHHNLYLDMFRKSTMPIYVVLVWFISFLLNLPVMCGWGHHGYNPLSLHCALDYLQGYDYRLFLLFVGFGFPLNMLLFCYTRIFLFARATKKNLQKFQDKSIKSPKKSAIKATDIRLLRSILIIVTVFVLLWAPYALILLFDTALVWPRSVLIVAICMAHVSSMVNSIIYAATNKNFREGYVHLVKMCVCYFKWGDQNMVKNNGLMVASVDGSNTMKSKTLVNEQPAQNANNI